MKCASVRDLKNKTSEILRRAAREDVLITSRGRPVACLTRVTEDDLTLGSVAAQRRTVLDEREKKKMLRILSRIWKLKRERGKKWISQEHHDQVLYGNRPR